MKHPKSLRKDQVCTCTENKLCNNHKCRKIDCLNYVKKTDERFHYYCDEHMHCGLDVKIHGFCEGCLETFQDEDIELKIKYNFKDPQKEVE